MKVSREQIIQRLRELGYGMCVPVAQGRYMPAQISGDLIYTAGQLSRFDGGVLSGRLVDDKEIASAIRAAELCVGRCLVAAASVLPERGRIVGLLQMRGFLNASDAFTAHSRALDAASTLCEEVLGRDCQFVRTAIGVAGLPANGTCEMECIFRYEKLAGVSL